MLVHTYSLATRHAAREAAATAAGRAVEPRRSSLQGLAHAEVVRGVQVTADLETGTAASGIDEGSGSQPRLRRSGSEHYLGETFGSSVNSSLQRIGYGLLEASTAGKCSVCQLACAPAKLHSQCLIAGVLIHMLLIAPHCRSLGVHSSQLHRVRAAAALSAGVGGSGTRKQASI